MSLKGSDTLLKTLYMSTTSETVAVI